MQISDIKPRMEDIKRRYDRGDRESAHEDEDALCRDVLRAIADETAVNPQTLALAVLTLADATTERWYA